MTVTFGPASVACSCGWETHYTPPLIVDRPHVSISGSLVHCHDSAGKLIHHGHKAQ